MIYIKCFAQYKLMIEKDCEDRGEVKIKMDGQKGLMNLSALAVH